MNDLAYDLFTRLNRQLQSEPSAARRWLLKRQISRAAQDIAAEREEAHRPRGLDLVAFSPGSNRPLADPGASTYTAWRKLMEARSERFLSSDEQAMLVRLHNRLREEKWSGEQATELSRMGSAAAGPSTAFASTAERDGPPIPSAERRHLLGLIPAGRDVLHREEDRGDPIEHHRQEVDRMLELTEAGRAIVRHRKTRERAEAIGGAKGRRA